jgi:hypothetical protein
MATEIEVCNWSPDEDADPATHTFTFRRTRTSNQC